MLEAFHTGGGLCLAWDAQNGKKMYGLYSEIDRVELLRRLLGVAVEHRHAYEFIPVDTRVRAYADLDWEGTCACPTHVLASRIVAAIHEKVLKLHGITAEIVLACGSRFKTGGAYKHSYHLVVLNLIFENNHDGEMKRFFTEGLDFPWTNEKGEKKQIIDTTVYSRNRVLRLPHCTKAGSDVPLMPIKATPDNMVEPALPFFVTDQREPEGGAVVVSSQTPSVQIQPIPVQKRVANKRQKTALDSRPLPFPIQILQEMLDSAGDQVSVPTRQTWLDHEQAWQVQCDQGKHTRQCMVRSSETHSSNNILLFVNKFQRQFRVRYHCTATGCSGCAGVVLGYVYLDEEQEWDWYLFGQHKKENEEESSVATNMRTEILDPENPQLNAYELVKTRFERQCFKTDLPTGYARILEGREYEPLLMSHTELRQCFCDWTYWKFDKEGKAKKTKFIDVWLDDPFKRVVRELVIDPSGTQKGCYNMWRPYIATGLSPVSDERVHELTRPIVRHLDEVVTKSNHAHTEWILDYFANIVQRPEKPTQVAILFYGQQGVGKGIIPEFLRLKVLGTHCTKQTAQPDQDIFGRFGNAAVNTVLLQVDEVKSLHDHSDRLKDLITNPTLNYEKKGRDPVVVQNLTNLIMTSNNANVLTVSSDDRRLVLFECTSIHMGDADYFNNLGEHLDKPEVARAFYQFLKARDLSNYPKSFQRQRPITDYYKVAQQNSIPVICRFFSALINGKCPVSMPCRDLYKDYEKFHTAGNYKTLMTETAFGRETKKIEGVVPMRNRTSRRYDLYPLLIRDYLRKRNELDADSEYPYDRSWSSGVDEGP